MSSLVVHFLSSRSMFDVVAHQCCLQTRDQGSRGKRSKKAYLSPADRIKKVNLCCGKRAVTCFLAVAASIRVGRRPSSRRRTSGRHTRSITHRDIECQICHTALKHLYFHYHLILAWLTSNEARDRHRLRCTVRRLDRVSHGERGIYPLE